MSLVKIDRCTCKTSHYPSKRTSKDNFLMDRIYARRCLKQQHHSKGVNLRTYEFLDLMVKNGKLTAGTKCGWPSEKRADEPNTIS